MLTGLLHLLPIGFSCTELDGRECSVQLSNTQSTGLTTGACRTGKGIPNSPGPQSLSEPFPIGEGLSLPIGMSSCNVCCIPSILGGDESCSAGGRDNFEHFKCLHERGVHSTPTTNSIADRKSVAGTRYSGKRWQHT